MDAINTPSFEKVYKHRKDQSRIRDVKYAGMLSSVDFFEVYEPSGYPIVFRTNSPIPLSESQLWEILRSKFGAIKLNIRVGNYGNPIEYAQHRKTQTRTLSDYLLGLDQDSTLEPPYAGNQIPPLPLLEEFGIGPPEFYPAAKFEEAAMWIGGPRSVTPLHKDGSDNFAVHIAGSKLWTLFPVRDAPFLYLQRILPQSDFAVSSIDLRNVDEVKFPLFKQARCIRVTVHGGETLYIPEGWGHFVKNVSNSFMINYWIRNENKVRP